MNLQLLKDGVDVENQDQRNQALHDRGNQVKGEFIFLQPEAGKNERHQAGQQNQADENGGDPQLPLSALNAAEMGLCGVNRLDEFGLTFWWFGQFHGAPIGDSAGCGIHDRLCATRTDAPTRKVWLQCLLHDAGHPIRHSATTNRNSTGGTSHEAGIDQT